MWLLTMSLLEVEMDSEVEFRGSKTFTAQHPLLTARIFMYDRYKQQIPEDSRIAAAICTYVHTFGYASLYASSKKRLGASPVGS